MQRRLLHGRDHEPPVRAHARGEMRAFPFQRLGRALRVGEPERYAVVMRDGETNTLRGERQSADGRRHLEHALGTLAAAARTPACPPTRRPRRSGRPPHGRSSDACHRWPPRCRRPPRRWTPPCRRPRRSRCGRRPRSSKGWRRRAPPPCARSPAFGTNSSASSPSTNTAVWPRKCAATTGASALNGRVRSTTEGISLLVSVTAQSALFPGMQINGRIARTLHACARLLKGATPGTVTLARGSFLLGSTGTMVVDRPFRGRQIFSPTDRIFT